MAATSAQMDAADQRRFEREESAYYRLSPAARTRRAQLWMRLAQGERTAETLRREYAADINGVQSGVSMYTPLAFSALRNLPDAAKVLLAAGAHVNARDSIGNTPLMIAARSGSAAVAEVLIRGGAALEARDKVGWTVLMHAAYNGNSEITLLLLLAGADPLAVDKRGVTALERGFEGDSVEACVLLMNSRRDFVLANDAKLRCHRVQRVRSAFEQVCTRAAIELMLGSAPRSESAVGVAARSRMYDPAVWRVVHRFLL